MNNKPTRELRHLKPDFSLASSPGNRTNPATRIANPSRLLHLGAWVLTILLSTFAGYQSLFSTHAEYDDEGYVMMSLANFMKGHDLYEATYTQYGPGFFFLTAGIHRVTDLPITHTAIRIKSLCIWTLLAGLTAAIFLRIVRDQNGEGSQNIESRWLAIVVFITAFFHLDKMPLEPGHPQELCALLVTLTAYAGTYLKDCVRLRQNASILVLMGALCGLAFTCKVNVGVFLSISCGIAVISFIRHELARKCLLTLSLVVTVGLIFHLYRSHLVDWVAIQLPILCLGGMGLLAMATWSANIPSLKKRPAVSALASTLRLQILVASTAATAFSILLLTRMSGTTWSGIQYGLIGQHSGFADGFFHPVRLPPFAMMLLAISGCVAILGRTNWTVDWRIVGFFALTCGVTVLVVVGTQIVESRKPVIHGLNPRGAHSAILGTVVPALWVFFNRRRNASRRTLAFVACLQPLIAFPVSGSQVAFGSLPLLAVCFVLIVDGWAAFQPVAIHGLRSGRKSLRTLYPSICGVLMICLIFGRANCSYRYRADRAPLRLPGAENLRLDPEFVARQRWLVEKLGKEATTFVFTQHTRNSLYFWSELEAPNAVNATFWPFMLNSQEQSSIVASLATRNHVGIVDESHYESTPIGPLAQHLNARIESSRQQFVNGRTTVWVAN